MTKIILLNGVGSSGKSSIAKALQFLADDPWLHLSMDMLFEMIPSKYQDSFISFIPNQNNYGDAVRIETSPAGKQLFSLLPKCANLIADTGNNLIIDEVILDEQGIDIYREKLSNHQFCVIGIMCSLANLQERELLRGDRAIGLANWQYDIVHKNKSYDLTIDTTNLSAFDAARLILDKVK